MKFVTLETGRHLRARALIEGPEERMRALQALSHGYGKGSEDVLARMLLATLGGDDRPEDLIICTEEVLADIAKATVTRVAEPMQESSNDSSFIIKGATTASGPG